MKGFLTCLILWGIAVAVHAGDSFLDSLPVLRSYEMRRITSHDPTGGNQDWRSLAPGATLVLANIKGHRCGAAGPVVTVLVQYVSATGVSLIPRHVRSAAAIHGYGRVSQRTGRLDRGG